MKEKRITTDILIIGSGIAGLMAAIELSKQREVTLVTKGALGTGNSTRAQGGIAAALENKDSPHLHMQDTLKAGHSYNNQQTVKKLIEQSPQVMEFLFSNGVLFDKNNQGDYHLAKEGAHSCRRIYHAGGDATGYHIMKPLKQQVKDNVHVMEHFWAYDLLIDQDECIGLRGKSQDGTMCKIFSNTTVLATGGCGQLYSITSNAEESTGDGLAMAYRAGVRLVDMEFMQFHPTMLYADGKGAGLLSEAIRGEGGILVDEHHQPIMEGKHELKDLAPRSVVAKAVYETWQAGGEVYLSIKQIPQFEQKFPSITSRLRAHHIDLKKGMLPVRPGAHFMMGGIETNEYGQTNKNGLYAIGETACTGMHGANRLASNSLLEGAAGALLLSKHLATQAVTSKKRRLPTTWADSSNIEDIPALHELQERMDGWAGIVKEQHQLLSMKEWLSRYEAFIFSPASYQLSKQQLAVKNMLAVAWMVTTAALIRTESRGAHLRTDYEQERIEWASFSIYWEKKERAPIVKTNTGREALHEYITP
ncbi:L-aspartate oxidase [Alteribacillus bidgolensis]|uniref:L-aspartate oxidase n=1 Tax=Alteribacillus bidgolensis TaxID=930129 RepID=A0A1G8GXM3_9BACI|nr:L-aspartate oxidase [Alteribacillus bidgolensis]SDH99156.1 L-aspartate oxidase [Alteribacillus bidgolensis]